MAGYPCENVFRRFQVRSDCCFSIPKAGCSGVGWSNDCVNESTPPANFDYRTKLQQRTTGNPSAACLCWINWSSSLSLVSVSCEKEEKMRSEQTMRSQPTYMWIACRCRKRGQRSRAVTDPTQAFQEETAGAAE